MRRSQSSLYECPVNQLHSARQRRDVKLTGENEEQKADEQAVPQIEHPGSNAPKAKFADPVDQSVGKNIASRSPSGRKRPPLPVVVFAAEEEVDEQDGDRAASDNHDRIREEEEAKHVVHFA